MGGSEGHASSSIATIHIDLRPRKWRNPLRIVIMLFEFQWTKSFINCCLHTCGMYSWLGVGRTKVSHAFGSFFVLWDLWILLLLSMEFDCRFLSIGGDDMMSCWR